MTATNGSSHQVGVDALNRVEKADVGGHMDDPERARREHHRHLGHVTECREHLGVPRVDVPGKVQGLLVERRRADRLNPALQWPVRRPPAESEPALPRLRREFAEGEIRWEPIRFEDIDGAGIEPCLVDRLDRVHVHVEARRCPPPDSAAPSRPVPPAGMFAAPPPLRSALTTTCGPDARAVAHGDPDDGCVDSSVSALHAIDLIGMRLLGPLDASVRGMAERARLGDDVSSRRHAADGPRLELAYDILSSPCFRQPRTLRAVAPAGQNQDPSVGGMRSATSPATPVPPQDRMPGRMVIRLVPSGDDQMTVRRRHLAVASTNPSFGTTGFGRWHQRLVFGVEFSPPEHVPGWPMSATHSPNTATHRRGEVACRRPAKAKARSRPWPPRGEPPRARAIAFARPAVPTQIVVFLNGLAQHPSPRSVEIGIRRRRRIPLRRLPALIDHLGTATGGLPGGIHSNRSAQSRARPALKA